MPISTVQIPGAPNGSVPQNICSSGTFLLAGRCERNKTPKVVSVGCVGPWNHINGVLSEFGKIRETGKMCHVMSIDE